MCKEIHRSIDRVGHLGPLMGYCDHQMLRLMARELRQYDISPIQCRTLIFLQETEGEVNQRMLERFLMVKPSTASGIVGRLEEKGLLLRQTSEKDGRCRILALTEQGRQFNQQFRAISRQVDQQAGTGLTEEERALLRQLLLRVAANLSERQEGTE